jgi:hypothetical protein
MTNDDAKYREWWDKLKGEFTDEAQGGPLSSLDDIIGAQNALRRMLKIEQEGK